MYIDKLSLRNFKCFEKVDISLSKITLLTGANSSGKSSLIYALLGPLQSRGFPQYISPNGKHVNMGDYKEIVFKHLSNRHVGVDIGATELDGSDKYFITTDWALDKLNTMPKLHHLKYSMPYVDIEISATNSGKYVLSFWFEPKKFAKSHIAEIDKAFRPLYKMFMDMNSKIRSKKKKKVKRPRYDLFKPYHLRGRRFYSLKKLNDEYPVLSRLLFFIGQTATNINFISSFRLQPDRTYYQKSGIGEKVRKDGENYINQILEWEEQKSKKFQDLKSVLKDLKLLYNLKSNKLTGGRFEFRVKTTHGSSWSLLPDVGFGISQFLPIIVADLQLSPASTLFLAQPEIHLHPSVQADMGDYFIKQVNKKRKRYIVETHSEYLLNRIRLAIAQGRLKTSDVSVYYLENTKTGTQTTEIIFKKNGEIENAPKSFFKTYMMDVMDIALNAK